jgi:lipopolysaccharide biosynthesis glycosyltransferase
MRGLVFSIDDDYVIGFLVFWTSLVETDSIPEETPIFFLHEHSLSDVAIAKISKKLAQDGFIFNFIDVSSALPKELPLNVGEHVSRATFYRLFAHQLLPLSITSIVYLDSDLLALKSCKGLFNQTLSAPVAACDHCAPRLGLQFWGDKNGTYFQAGVLIIDLTYWRAHHIEDKFLRILEEERRRIRFWDQDVLNIAFQEVWQRLPVWFNIGQDATSTLGEDEVAKKTIIAHFDNPYKPWNSRTNRMFATCWDETCLRIPDLNFKPPKRKISLFEKLVFRFRKLAFK